MKRNGECVVARREYVDEDWKMHQNIHIRTVEYILNCTDNASEYPHSYPGIYP